MISPKTKAIIPVHLFGQSAPMDEIKTIAGDIPLIEDGACAAGSAYKGVPAGGLGLMGCFSFHPRKSITTGEGGMITTNHEEYFLKCSSIRSIGIDVKSKSEVFNNLGTNNRMAEFEAILGLSQLPRLDQAVHKRAENYSKFLSILDPNKFEVVP